MKKKNNIVSVGFYALGCPKNVVDSEKMLAQIAQAGFLICSDPEEADVVVVNTCGFIEPAKQEALEIIRRAVELKREGRVKRVVVAGCLSQRMGKDLFDHVVGIDAVVGLAERDEIGGVIKDVLVGEETRFYMSRAESSVNDTGRLLITPGHWAYLRISEGCDHKCSFCTIPAIRGKFRSKPMDGILKEAEELVSAGVVELNVIAQDTAYYGKEIGMKDGLAKLLKELEKIEGLEWIRLMYVYPTGITDKLIETIAESKKILPYIDMPIQHINDEILKMMRRPDTKKRISAVIDKLRKALPDMVLRTTVIVGFPGETDEQFEELVDFVKDKRFDALGCFTYFAEDGTAASQFQGQIADNIKKARQDKLMLAQQRIAFEKNSERIGKELICLVDSIDGKKRVGRFYGQAPEIDSVCIMKKCKVKSGQFVKAKVVDFSDYDLVLEQVKH
ncbi:MAG: 30S ribosomal protein S12 methylthiotransferase RimO [Phycisphaerae bacterium]|nr:30S ribosomal protein S12 methylthiotransferase RimO [Phycisphaerae bacterium]